MLSINGNECLTDNAPAGWVWIRPNGEIALFGTTKTNTAMEGQGFFVFA